MRSIARKIRSLTTGNKRRKAASLAAVLCVGIGAFAVAQFVSGGSGGGGGKVGETLASITVTAGPNNGSLLLPTTDSDMSASVTNPAGVPLSIVSVEDNAGPYTIQSQGPDGDCTPEMLAAGIIVNPDHGDGVAIPKGSSTVVVDDLWHGAAALNGHCAGVSFSKEVTIVAQPAA